MMIFDYIGLFQKKNSHPHDGRHARKSHGGVNGSGNPDGRGALYLKILACVASISSRGSSRKLEREQKKN